MKKISGVIFDMDGLIFDTEAIYSEVNIETARTYGLKGFDKAYYKGEIGVGEKQAYERYLKDFSYLPKETIDEFFKVSRDKVRNVFEKEGAPIKQGALELLSYLKEKKIPCVIASSNHRNAIEKLVKKAEITDYFIDIVSGDDVTHAKPHPEIVEVALKKLGTKADETLMLEDSINGIKAASQANVTVIMVPDLIEPTDEALEKAYDIKRDLLGVLAFIKEIN